MCELWVQGLCVDRLRVEYLYSEAFLMSGIIIPAGVCCSAFGWIVMKFMVNRLRYHD